MGIRSWLADNLVTKPLTWAAKKAGIVGNDAAEAIARNGNEISAAARDTYRTARRELIERSQQIRARAANDADDALGRRASDSEIVRRLKSDPVLRDARTNVARDLRAARETAGLNGRDVAESGALALSKTQKAAINARGMTEAEFLALKPLQRSAILAPTSAGGATGGAASTGFGAQLKSWGAKTAIAIGAGGLAVGASTSLISEDDFASRRILDATVGGLLDKITGTYDKIGYTGETIIGMMTDDPAYAAKLINPALGTKIQIGEDGIIPPNQLEDALRILATQGVRGKSFFEAPQIIEAYLKNQLGIPQDTKLEEALTRQPRRELQDNNAKMLERAASGDLTGALAGNPERHQGGAADAPAARPNTISVTNALTGLQGFMEAVNIKVHFTEMSAIVKASDLNKDGELSIEEVNGAATKIKANPKIESSLKDGIIATISP